MQKYKPNKTQEIAFNKVVKAIKSANKKGLVFYGKSALLVAYTKAADDYIEKYGFEVCLRRGFENGQIHTLNEHILSDSGADDYPHYQKKEDNPDF